MYIHVHVHSTYMYIHVHIHNNYYIHVHVHTYIHTCTYMLYKPPFVVFQYLIENEISGTFPLSVCRYPLDQRSVPLKLHPQTQPYYLIKDHYKRSNYQYKKILKLASLKHDIIKIILICNSSNYQYKKVKGYTQYLFFKNDITEIILIYLIVLIISIKETILKLVYRVQLRLL